MNQPRCCFTAQGVTKKINRTFHEVRKDHTRICCICEIQESQGSDPADSEHQLGPPHQSPNPAAQEKADKTKMGKIADLP